MKTMTHTSFNDGKLRVAVVTGTRPEIIRLSQIIRRLSVYFDCDHLFSGQNYTDELWRHLLEDLYLPDPIFINERVEATSSPIGHIATTLNGIDKILRMKKYDAFVVLGDTNSALSAYVAKRNKIPVFHLEAGNRCFDQNVPEEINRRIVDSIADVNLTYSSQARTNLLNEGFDPRRVICVGSPLREVLNFYRTKIDQSNVLARFSLTKSKYLVLSIHREENLVQVDKLKQFFTYLEQLSSREKLDVIVSLHPKTQSVLKRGGIALSSSFKWTPPLPYTDYISLLESCFAILSDSGTLNEEAYMLNIERAINLRQTHERPEADEYGTTIMTGLCPERIQSCMYYFQGRASSQALLEFPNRSRLIDAYERQDVSESVARIIMSYIVNVNRYVWNR
jgi:UDP-N-acetylglucosamine 2-epimerase